MDRKSGLCRRDDSHIGMCLSLAGSAVLCGTEQLQANPSKMMTLITESISLLPVLKCAAGR